MAKSAPIYDLMLLLDSSLEEDRRTKILADVEQAIAGGGGSVELKQEWGARRLSFEIDHKGDAEYHLLQFGGPPSLVETLGYNLKITDGVLRHRIIKVLPGTPPAPEPSAAEPVAAAAPVETPAEPTAEAPAEPTAERPSEPTAEAPAEASAEAPADASEPAATPESESEPAEAPAAP